jgi:hypothetical protein
MFGDQQAQKLAQLAKVFATLLHTLYIPTELPGANGHQRHVRFPNP